MALAGQVSNMVKGECHANRPSNCAGKLGSGTVCGMCRALGLGGAGSQHSKLSTHSGRSMPCDTTSSWLEWFPKQSLREWAGASAGIAKQRCSSAALRECPVQAPCSRSHSPSPPLTAPPPPPPATPPAQPSLAPTPAPVPAAATSKESAVSRPAAPSPSSPAAAK